MTFGWCWDLAHLFGGPDFLDYLSSLDVVAFVAVSILEVKFLGNVGRSTWSLVIQRQVCRGSMVSSMVSWNLDVFYVTTSEAPLAALHKAFSPFS